MRLHGIPKKTISYRDAKFTCRFGKELFAGLGAKLAFSVAYHLQTNDRKRGSTRYVEDVYNSSVDEMGGVSSTNGVFLQQWL